MGAVLKLPDWPAAMGARMAAAYVDLSETALHTLVRAGRFPQPIHLSEGRKGWRRSDVDAWISQGGVDGWAGNGSTVERNPWDEP